MWAVGVGFRHYRYRLSKWSYFGSAMIIIVVVYRHFMRLPYRNFSVSNPSTWFVLDVRSIRVYARIPAGYVVSSVPGTRYAVSCVTDIRRTRYLVYTKQGIHYLYRYLYYGCVLASFQAHWNGWNGWNGIFLDWLL